MANDVSLLLGLFADTKSPDVSAALDVKLKELEKLPDYPAISEYLVDRYKSYSKIDFTSLLQINKLGIGGSDD